MPLALLLRLALIVRAQWVLQHPPVQILQRRIWLWLFIDHLRTRGDAAAEDESAEAGLVGSLARTVVLLAFTDLAFSIDSVAAAVAIGDQTLLIGTGAVIGIIALRFTSGLFIRWLEIYPRLGDRRLSRCGFRCGSSAACGLARPSSNRTG